MKTFTAFSACSAILMCALCAAPNALASSSQLELQWSDLGPTVAGHRVQLVLPDGARIQGQVVVVRDDALVLNVNKTSNSQSHPKGQQVVPRASVSTLQLESNRGSGKTMGVIVGALGGLILGGDLVAHAARSEAAAVPAFFGISTASTLAGYYIGKAHDRQATIIRIVPNQ